ncbi:HesA/MoeB/ThiF family protein [Dickeya zeae]|uniref:HesA/MoeB/ThiF family protein n=1 Tax=Dickeya zeae TaxID=204042 RepID=UPI00036B9A91|nr:ThiF family adenylyltransferase [Dickeya zeae]UJR53270.1 ThiF family adenylyltransferase [Dickeya zeae MS1]
MLYTGKYIQVGRYKKGGVFGVGSKQIIFNERIDFEDIVKIASFWKTPSDPNSFVEKAKKNFPEMSVSKIENCIQFLFDNNSLMENNDFNSNDRYSRNSLYYNYMGANSKDVQEKIQNSSVTLIGCGGIGNHLSYLLATSGIGKITLVDNDKVELSNLTRQVLFTEKDIGNSKTEVLKRELLKRRNDVAIDIIECTITSEDDLYKIPKSDIFIISADHPFSLMDWVNSYCVAHNQPYINVGYINDISVVGPFFIPGVTSCFKCAEITPDYTQKDSLSDYLKIINGDFKAATFPGVNGVAASYAFGDIIKFLGGFGEILSKNKRIGIHSSIIKIEEQLIPKNERCFVCSRL